MRKKMYVLRTWTKEYCIVYIEKCQKNASETEKKRNRVITSTWQVHTQPPNTRHWQPSATNDLNISFFFLYFIFKWLCNCVEAFFNQLLNKSWQFIIQLWSLLYTGRMDLTLILTPSCTVLLRRGQRKSHASLQLLLYTTVEKGSKGFLPPTPQ